MARTAKKQLIDTICALSTPKGQSALAIVRISGPESLDVISNMMKTPKVLEPRKATKLLLYDSESRPLDEVIVSYFAAPNSFTGEDVVEVNCHGNPFIVEKLLNEIVSRGTRPAEPGEFTRRALANAKLSLDEVEALDWVLNGRSPESIRLGLRAKMDGLTAGVDRVSQDLLELIADMEALLDFPEHEVGEEWGKSFGKRIHALQERLESWLKFFERNQSLLDNCVLVLVGPPNSGKSSLFNALIGAEKAIVYEEPGTTRDFLEQSFEFNGRSLVLVDTAGLREARNPIEQMGIRRTKQAMKRADVIVWVNDEGKLPPKELFDEFSNHKWIYCSSKSDLNGPKLPDSISVSAKRQLGLDSLLAEALPFDPSEPDAEIILTSSRQREKVAKALASLQSAAERLDQPDALEWVAQALIEAKNSLSDLVGEMPTDEILKSILSRFCIGK